MKIEEGKFYKTRDGRKVGPMVRWCDDFQARRPWSTSKGYDTSPCWGDDGNTAILGNVLISEWEEGPIRTVTRRIIEPGDYGIIEVMLDKHGQLEIGLNYTRVDANDLRSAAMILSQLAEALDDNADNA